MFHINFWFVAILAIAGELAASKLPEYIKVCKRDQNTINDCVKSSINGMRSHLPQGIPEINVPSVDPFTIDELKPRGVGDLKTAFKDVQVVGLSDFDIKKLDVDLASMVIKATLAFPVLRVSGHYNVDLQILTVPIKGDGPFAANITDVTANVVLKYKLERHDGNDYVKFSSCDLAVTLHDFHITMEGLLSDALGNAGHQIIHDNRKELLRIVLPYLENTISNAVVLELANHVASAVTYDELLPQP